MAKGGPEFHDIAEQAVHRMRNRWKQFGDESQSDRNDAEWVRQSVIDDVRSGTRISRSGAWVAERFDEHGEIRVYKVDEVLEL
ncbi:hypothetical protein SAMN05421809_3743 [Natronorubrum daqingense]|uniref:Uncharacterized protein n=1 Tax=Natronorubrum daqingense TaxID=588898 RepID=A0A1N7G5D2_9EURY|nr:hypothetical protein BB347_18595 [Natronorubrum daqingense]SIS07810.1 hypothetical protein SAMN05421809_3743 [Natronorubrum daqingense]